VAVNFDALPSSNPTSIPGVGFYKFTVLKAEVKQGKDTSKPPYLNLTYSLQDIKGKKCGNFFDMLFDSDAPAPSYKLKRFVLGIGLDLHGSMELRDLAKIVIGRSGVLEIEHKPDDRDPNTMRAAVRLFGSDCFWPLSEFASLAGDTAPSQATPDADAAFTFSDDDAPVPPAPAAAPADSEY